ncbi:hypothetical protein D3C71_1957410 [compost metagenome]
MADSCAVIWALPLRSTIRLRASANRPPWPQPSTTAQSQTVDSGAKSSPISEVKLSAVSPTASARWSRQRAATEGTSREVTNWARVVKATT